MFVLVALYTVIIAQYCHIYVAVRKSSRNAGVRRETKLASRICVMVGTSFVFFVVPNLAMMVMTVGSVQLPLTRVQQTVIKKWLPPMFLVLNACINPLLFAYRNDKFVKSLKALSSKIVNFIISKSNVQSQREVQVSRNHGYEDEPPKTMRILRVSLEPSTPESIELHINQSQDSKL